MQRRDLGPQRRLEIHALRLTAAVLIEFWPEDGCNRTETASAPAIGTVRKTSPAAGNSSVFRLLWHHHNRTMASATDNSLDRICCNARSARKVRCGGSVFSQRAPQP